MASLNYDKCYSRDVVVMLNCHTIPFNGDSDSDSDSGLDSSGMDGFTVRRPLVDEAGEEETFNMDLGGDSEAAETEKVAFNMDPGSASKLTAALDEEGFADDEAKTGAKMKKPRKKENREKSVYKKYSM